MMCMWPCTRLSILFTWGALECFCLASVFNTWVHVYPLLRQQKIFSHLCSPPGADEALAFINVNTTVCVPQERAFYWTDISSRMISALVFIPVALVYDRLGTMYFRILGM